MAHVHHDHGPEGERWSGTGARRPLVAVLVVVALVAVAGLALLWPRGDRTDLGDVLGLGAELVDATVTGLDDVPCAGTEEGLGVRCLLVRFDVTSGTPTGATGSFELPVTEALVDFSVGDGIVAAYQADADPQFAYRFADFQRDVPLAVLAVIFVVAVLALGRWQGVRALVGLGVTGVVLVAFLFPAVLDGRDPILVALVAAVVIGMTALYLTHGVNDRTTVALLGTFAALGVTAVLAAVFTSLARFTGLATEDAYYLRVASEAVDIKGLVLAGIIVGSLGVLDDVTVTQVSAVWQLHRANPAFGPLRLWRAGVAIGRDHIAATVNTLVLAYAGASLPLLLVYTQAGRGLGEVATGEVVAVEVVRTLVGSIGLVTAVPITTALAVWLFTTRTGPGSDATASPSPLPAGPSAGAEDAERSGATDAANPAAWEQFAPREEW